MSPAYDIYELQNRVEVFYFGACPSTRLVESLSLPVLIYSAPSFIRCYVLYRMLQKADDEFRTKIQRLVQSGLLQFQR
jgi:hypothetical protein